MIKHLFLLTLPLLLLSLGCQNDLVDPAAQAAEDEQLIKDYLAEQNIDAQRHDSGLYYIIEEEGSGGSPNLNSEVQARYKGYLLDGSVFDETPGNDTRFFPLRNVIRGWQIGIPLLQKEGRGTFFIPSNLGYGFRAQPGIPASSVLIFETELVNFQ